jgi:hypothetical protein
MTAKPPPKGPLRAIGGTRPTSGKPAKPAPAIGPTRGKDAARPDSAADVPPRPDTKK